MSNNLNKNRTIEVTNTNNIQHVIAFDKGSDLPVKIPYSAVAGGNSEEDSGNNNGKIEYIATLTPNDADPIILTEISNNTGATFSTARGGVGLLSIISDIDIFYASNLEYFFSGGATGTILVSNPVITSPTQLDSQIRVGISSAELNEPILMRLTFHS